MFCLEGFGIMKTCQDDWTVEPELLKSSLFARTSLLLCCIMAKTQNSWIHDS